MRNEIPYALAIMLLIMWFFTIAILASVDEKLENLQAQAVQRGHAEWVVLGTNHTEFKWKEKENEN